MWLKVPFFIPPLYKKVQISYICFGKKAKKKEKKQN
jgi:hypothetical protein